MMNNIQNKVNRIAKVTFALPQVDAYVSTLHLATTPVCMGHFVIRRQLRKTISVKVIVVLFLSLNPYKRPVNGLLCQSEKKKVDQNTGSPEILMIPRDNSGDTRFVLLSPFEKSTCIFFVGTSSSF